MRCNVWGGSDLFDGFYNATGIFFFTVPPHPALSHTKLLFNITPELFEREKRRFVFNEICIKKKKDQTIAEEIYLINKLSKDK